MNQGDLFTTEQQKQLKRAKSRLGTEILLWANRRLRARATQFYADDLRQDLTTQGVKFAPGSADRVLRHLRQIKVVDYKVVCRPKSLYELTGCAMTGGKS